MARAGIRLVALLLTALASVLLLERLTVTAQPAGKVYRIGVLSPGSAQGSSVEVAALRTRLREVAQDPGPDHPAISAAAGGSADRMSVSKTCPTPSCRGTARKPAASFGNLRQSGQPPVRGSHGRGCDDGTGEG